MSFGYFSLLEKKKWDLLQKQLKNIKKDSEIEEYVTTVLECIENRELPSYRIKLEGFVKLHCKFCIKIDCNCKNIIQDQLKEEDDGEKSKNWYLFLKYIMEESLKRFSKSSRLRLLFGYIYQEKIKNIFKALYEIMQARAAKPNLQEELSIYRYMNILENEMKEQDAIENSQSGFDVNLIIKYENLFEEFLENLQKIVQLHLEFWRELLEESPDIVKLQNNGSKITAYLDYIQKLYNNLSKLNSNNSKTLEIYGNFLQDILYDDAEANKILERLEYLNKSGGSSKMTTVLGIHDSENTAIVTISGNQESMCIINNANNQITQITQHTKGELIGQNVNKIIPKVIADKHNLIVQNFLENRAKNSFGAGATVMALTKSGYLKICILTVKILPDLSQGIQLIGFLRPQVENLQKNIGKTEFGVQEENHYMIYNKETGLLYGVSQNCMKNFGLYCQLVYGNPQNSFEFTIDIICPELLDKNNFEQLNSEQGLECQFDTTLLQQNYLLGGNEQQEASEQKFVQEEQIDEEIQNQQQQSLEKSNLKQNLNKSSAKQNKSMLATQTIDQSHIQPQQYQQIKQQQGLQANSHKLTNEIQSMQYKFRKTVIRAKHIGTIMVDETTQIEFIKFIEVDQDVQKQGMDAARPESGKYESAKTDYSQLKSNEINYQQTPNYDIENENEINSQDHEKEQQGEGEGAHEIIEGSNEDKKVLSGKKSGTGDSQMSLEAKNDEMRQLKDFKQMMADKFVPKSIKNLKRTFVLLILVLLTLSIIDIIKKYNQKSITIDAIFSIDKSYQRHSIMADVNLETRRLDLLQRQLIEISQGSIQQDENLIKNKLFNQIESLRQIQFDIIQSRMIIESKMTNKAELEKYEIKQKLLNSEITTYESIYNDALFQYITYSSSLSNASISDFNSTQLTQTQINFFYVVQNGLFVLLEGSDFIAQRFYIFYNDFLKKFKTTYLIIMIFGIIAIILSAIILIPIVFTVHKTNNVVLSLFGNLPLIDIKNLIQKCDEFYMKFLEEKDKLMLDKDEAEQKNEAQDQYDENELEEDKNSEMSQEENSYIEKNYEDDDKVQLNTPSKEQSPVEQQKSFKAKQQFMTNVNQSEVKSKQQQQSNLSKFAKQQKSTTQGMAKKLVDVTSLNKSKIKQQSSSKIQKEMYDKQYDSDEEMKQHDKSNINMLQQTQQVKNEKEETQQDDEEDWEQIRSQKLMNSKDNNRKIIIIQFCIFAVVFLLYFIMKYINEISILNNLKICLLHQQFLNDRPSTVKYVLVFSQEEISEMEPQIYKQEDQRLFYIQKSYDNQREIQNQFKQINSKSQLIFKSAFDQYKNLYNEITTNSICSYLGISQAEATECSKLSEFSRDGLDLVQITYIETLREIVTQFNIGNKTEITQKLYLNTPQMKISMDLLKYLKEALKVLNEKFIDGFQSYIQKETNLVLIIFILFLIALAIIILFFWLPYLKNLSVKVWRIKGMLKQYSMIPLEVISSNENLKNAFMSEEIIQALK